MAWLGRCAFALVASVMFSHHVFIEKVLSHHVCIEKNYSRKCKIVLIRIKNLLFQAISSYIACSGRDFQCDFASAAFVMFFWSCVFGQIDFCFPVTGVKDVLFFRWIFFFSCPIFLFPTNESHILCWYMFFISFFSLLDTNILLFWPIWGCFGSKWAFLSIFTVFWGKHKKF